MTGRIEEPPADLETLRSAAGLAICERTLRGVAREVGISPTGLSKFVRRDSEFPYSPTLRRLRRWYAKHASTESER